MDFQMAVNLCSFFLCLFIVPLNSSVINTGFRDTILLKDVKCMQGYAVVSWIYYQTSSSPNYTETTVMIERSTAKDLPSVVHTTEVAETHLRKLVETTIPTESDTPYTFQMISKNSYAEKKSTKISCASQPSCAKLVANWKGLKYEDYPRLLTRDSVIFYRVEGKKDTDHKFTQLVTLTADKEEHTITDVNTFCHKYEVNVYAIISNRKPFLFIMEILLSGYYRLQCPDKSDHPNPNKICFLNTKPAYDRSLSINWNCAEEVKHNLSGFRMAYGKYIGNLREIETVKEKIDIGPDMEETTVNNVETNQKYKIKMCMVLQKERLTDWEEMYVITPPCHKTVKVTSKKEHSLERKKFLHQNADALIRRNDEFCDFAGRAWPEFLKIFIPYIAVPILLVLGCIYIVRFCPQRIEGPRHGYSNRIYLSRGQAYAQVKRVRHQYRLGPDGKYRPLGPPSSGHIIAAITEEFVPEDEQLVSSFPSSEDLPCLGSGSLKSILTMAMVPIGESDTSDDEDEKELEVTVDLPNPLVDEITSLDPLNVQYPSIIDRMEAAIQQRLRRFPFLRRNRNDDIELNDLGDRATERDDVRRHFQGHFYSISELERSRSNLRAPIIVIHELSARNVLTVSLP